MASDPHLVQSVPSLWYLAHIDAGDLNVAGVTLPSAPAVVIGHNQHVAWSLTNVMADYVDFVALERSGEDHYILAGDVKPFVTRTSTIRVRGAESISHETLWTDVGPVVTSLNDASHVLAMRWHALELEDQTATIFREINLAGTVDDAVSAADNPSAVAQHLLLADDQGHIGLVQLGTIVKRQGFSGRVPYPGSDAAYGWRGWLEERYVETDPEKGYLHSANSRIGYANADQISTSYIPPHRYERIREQLEATEVFDPDQMADLQLDVHDHEAEVKLDGFLKRARPTTTEAQRCAQLLADWNYEWTPDSVGATVWAMFRRELLREALQDDIGPENVERYLAIVASSRSLIYYGIKGFMNEPAAEIDRALHATCAILNEKFGNNSAHWSWGRHHPLRLEHPFAASSALLNGWNMPVREFGGSGSTIAAAGYGWDVTNTQVGGMASMRMVMPLNADEPARVAHPGGQSGQPGHPHYADLFDLFVKGQTIPLWYDEDDVRRATTTTMRLLPSP